MRMQVEPNFAAPEPVHEPVVAPEPPHLSDSEFPPQEPEFIPPIEAEPAPIEAEAFEPNFTAPEPSGSEPVVEPEHQHISYSEFLLPEPEFIPTAEAEPAVAPEPPHLSDSEFPPPEPEFIPPIETPAKPVPLDAYAVEPTFYRVPEPVDEPFIVPERQHLSIVEFTPPEPEVHPQGPREPISVMPPVFASAFPAPAPVEEPVIAPRAHFSTPWNSDP